MVLFFVVALVIVGVRRRRSRQAVDGGLIEAGFRQDFAGMFAEARRPAPAPPGVCASFTGMPGARWPSLSTSMSRCATCGCANACGTVLTAPAGTPARIRSRQRSSDLKPASVRSSSARSACDMPEPFGVGAKTRIVEQIVAPDLLAEPAELAVVEDAEKDLAVAGRELVVGRDVRMRAAEQAGRAARAEPVGRVRHQQAERRCRTASPRRAGPSRCARAPPAPSGCR